ncbi:MAG: response regulator transcription factor [Bacteroidota bacterium]
MHVLVIEDDPAVQTLVRTVLKHNGNEVSVVETAKEGENLANSKSYDIIVLDLGLPDGNGLELCERLRDNGIETPILILSAEQETDVKVRGFHSGADDYLTKPFSTEELMARIEAIQRRTQKKTTQEQLTCGEITINLLDRTCTVSGNDVSLTNNEFNLLAYFMQNSDRIIPQDELAAEVWDIHFDTQTNYINVYISYLRKKIRQNADREYIETVRKKGFILRCESKEN